MNFNEISAFFSEGFEAVTDGFKAQELYQKAMSDGVMSESEAMIIARAVAEIFNIDIVADELIEMELQALEDDRIAAEDEVD